MFWSVAKPTEDSILFNSYFPAIGVFDVYSEYKPIMFMNYNEFVKITARSLR